jgi:hypothetical protein
MGHEAEVKAVLRAYQKALDALQRLDRARQNFRSALLTAPEPRPRRPSFRYLIAPDRRRLRDHITSDALFLALSSSVAPQALVLRRL